MDIPRRSLDELYTKYDLHPEIFDIYVEGGFDHDFLSSFLEYFGHASNVSVFAIEDIDISGDVLDECGLGYGSNKLRVVALSKLLDEKYKARETNISCLIDMDEDKILDKTHSSHHLKYTDFTCAEMYMLNKKVISKLFIYTCQLPEACVDEFMRICGLILPAQFALRATNIYLNLNTAVRSFENGLKERRKFLSFNPEKYCMNYIVSGHMQKRTKEIKETFDNFLSKIEGDVRHFAHGHDFIYLLFNFMASKGGLRLHNNSEEDILKFGGRMLSMAIDMKELAAEPLFLRIKKSAEGESLMCTP